MITSRITDLHHSYFRFFLELLQDLKYEVFYEKDKKNLKLVVVSIQKSIIHHIDAICKFLLKKFNDGSVFCAFHFVNYHIRLELGLIGIHQLDKTI